MPDIAPSTAATEPVTGAAGDPRQDAPAVGSRPWAPPAFTDVELAAEVTAYAGRW
ncbi:pyrroloquinoline quinone precursor peptide PqqA [Streptomyces sp. UNOB3_S3]|uniref:pyrroloquinoline quinone precursor peptide PqqA n=1 Tax=Streptomyces sp. UNOB3_S3 TaxID=2871682 RepID=UPI001E40CF7F|nr:pyrroloquinoline quinone precursor peptide PqqA [Streptomyces sp. UNOB3_S3]MCC3773745.1 pyrroloquinoline quinone precursor peptide PqqA [Streptomyces sp. UNOB3_S3]